MKNLVKLDLGALHVAEAGQLITRYFEDFEKSGLRASADKDFEALHTSMKAKLPAYAAALDQVQGSEETKNILTADAQRDRRIRALRDALKAFRHADAEDEAGAYHALSLLMKEYKAVEDANYEEETLRLNVLLQRLKSPEYMPHVEMLDLQKFIAKLEAANRDFNGFFANRSHQNAGKVSMDVKKLKTELLEQYGRLAAYIAANAEVRADAFYKETLKVLNNGRTYFADTVLARRKATPKQGDAPKK